MARTFRSNHFIFTVCRRASLSLQEPASNGRQWTLHSSRR